MDDSGNLREGMAIVDDLVHGLRVELGARWDAWGRDLTKPHLHEVIGGLMARQVSLATQLAQAPSTWNGHVAPLILRAMTDAYITLAWVFREPEKRTDTYVKYGLGQRKLWLEHFKASLVKRGEKEPEENLFVKAITEQLNAERFEHITEVSVGTWSERSTRQMAEEAGCLDLYRLAYTPFSTAVTACGPISPTTTSDDVGTLCTSFTVCLKIPISNQTSTTCIELRNMSPRPSISSIEKLG